MFLFTKILAKCEQEGVNRSEKTLKTKQKRETARKRASVKMADMPVRKNQSSVHIELSGYDKKSPRRLRAKYTHCTRKLILCVFRPPGGPRRGVLWSAKVFNGR